MTATVFFGLLVIGLLSSVISMLNQILAEVKALRKELRNQPKGE